MKDLKSLIRLKKWALDERRRDLADLEGLKDDLIARATDIDEELERERAFVADCDQPSPGFSDFLRNSLKKRAQLSRSIEQSEVQITQVREIVATEFEALKQAEVALDRALARDARKRSKAEQAELDEIASTTHQRRTSSNA